MRIRDLRLFPQHLCLGLLFFVSASAKAELLENRFLQGSHAPEYFVVIVVVVIIVVPQKLFKLKGEAEIRFSQGGIRGTQR